MKYAYITLIVLHWAGSMSAIANIGKPQEPRTSTYAILSVLMSVLFTVLFIETIRRLG